MIVASEVQLYNVLKQKLGEKEAEALVEFVDAKLRDNNEVQSKILATKEDLAVVERRLDVKISETKAELIKWMFIFWIGQVAATFGFIFLFLNK